MRKFQFAIAIIVVGLLGLRYTVLAQEHDHKKHQMKTTQSKELAKEVYTCPMHPEVTSDKPGKCPKCKMNLEKKVVKMDKQTKIQKDVYTCPMHSEVTSDKAGKCPKCGMTLEKKTMSKAETKSQKKTEMYACPMHPDEKSDKAGNCPKCGMKLERVKK
jgi:transcription initiation factor IIE alpha subunit